MDLSVVVISHNHETMLHDCLASLDQALLNLETETIVLDNLPTGGAEALLRPSFPHVRFIRNESPVGLSENMNRSASASSGRYLLFLNPDTEYSAGQVADAIRYMRENPDIGLLTCRLLNPDGSLQQNYRRFPTLPVILGRAFGVGRWPWTPGFYRTRMMLGQVFDKPVAVDWVFGAFILIARDHYTAVGGMDPGFRLYYEDVDICYRLRQMGLKTVYYPDLRFIHRHMRTSARNWFGPVWRWHVRSAFRLLRKHGCWLRPPVDRAA